MGLEKLTRREFFKITSKGAARIGGILAVNVAFGAYRTIVPPKEETVVSVGPTTPDEKTVKYYAEDIAIAARKTAKRNLLGTIGALGGLFYLGDVGGELALRNVSKEQHEKVGGSSLVAGKLLDFYSTWEFAKVTGHPKFKEYGLHKYFFEINPFLPRNPTRTQVVFLGAPFLVFSWIVGKKIPWLGRGYLAMSPYIVSHNLEGKATMMYAFKLGSVIEEKLLQGTKEQQIKEYLTTVTPQMITTHNE